MRTELIKLKLMYRNDSVLYGLINTIIGECDRKGKDLTEDVIKSEIIKPMVINNRKMLKLEIPEDRRLQILIENKFLENYLPDGELTECELRDIISTHVSAGLKLPEIMKALKSSYPNKYDGKFAADIANELIKTTYGEIK